MVKRRFSALFLTLTLLLCTLPAAAAEGDDWLVPKVQEAPAFTDITGVWCEDAVQTVCQTGLMQGRSDGSFNPSGALTGAHIVTICARLYDLLTGGDGTLQEPAADQAWYDPAYKSLAEALDYAGGLDALRINIHPDKYSIRRWQFVELLDQTLTAADVTLPAINQITVLPDTTDTAVLKLCSAGILTGSDQYGSFRGNESLSRGQAAAILARLADPAQRQTFTPEPFDLCADVLGLEADSQAISIEYDGIAAELSTDILAPVLCDHLCRQFLNQFNHTPGGNDLDAAIADTVTTLKENVAVSRLADQMGITVTDQEIAEVYGPIVSGYRGMTAAAQQWEYTCTLLKNKLQEAYAEILGNTAWGESDLNDNLLEMMNEMTVLLAPEIQALDLSSVQARLVDSPAMWG